MRGVVWIIYQVLVLFISSPSPPLLSLTGLLRKTEKKREEIYYWTNTDIDTGFKTKEKAEQPSPRKGRNKGSVGVLAIGLI